MREQRVSGINAIVHAGGIEIQYSRSGRGAAVLLLLERPALRDRVRDVLSASFLVIVPELEALRRGAPTDVWLRGLIDGLGLREPHAVVDPEHAAAVEALAARDPQGLGRVALIEHEPLASGKGEPTHAAGAARSARPWLALWLNEDVDAATGELVELRQFLQGRAAES